MKSSRSEQNRSVGGPKKKQVVWKKSDETRKNAYKFDISTTSNVLYPWSVLRYYQQLDFGDEPLKKTFSLC